MTPATACADLQLRQSPRLRAMAGGSHLLAAAAVPLLSYPSPWIPALLLSVLALSTVQQWHRIVRDDRLLLIHRPDEGWRLRDGEAGERTVACRVLFLSTLLVVVAAGGRRLVLTPDSCAADGWRRLHILARAAAGGSGMVDDDVLGGKVDGHQNRVPGNG